MRRRKGLKQSQFQKPGVETDNDESLLDLHNKSGYLAEDQVITRI